MRIPFLIGRLLFGGYFLYNGINHFKNRSQLAQYAGSKGVPAPEVAVSATGAMLLAGGASIIAGVKPKVGAAAIAGFLAGVSPIMHNFWRAEDPNQANERYDQLHEKSRSFGGNAGIDERDGTLAGECAGGTTA